MDAVDVVIIGSGLAGLRLALALPEIGIHRINYQTIAIGYQYSVGARWDCNWLGRG